MNEANLTEASAMPGEDTGSAALVSTTRSADSDPPASPAAGATVDPAAESGTVELRRRQPWQRALQQAVRDIDELAKLLEIPAARLRAATCDSGFPLLVPRGYVARMKKRDVDDPLLLQVLPRRAENTGAPGFTDDPLLEQGIADEGVIRKYRGRALLIASGACPIHCRYCFRREFPYSEQLASRHGWKGAIDKLTHAGDISEVILSGGDPLSVTNRNLQALFDALQTIESVRCIRIHTRFPVTIPERIDTGLLGLLERCPAKLVVVVHCNHANELDASVESALEKIAGATDLLLNQSVLLRDINDDVATLARLSRRLFDCGVLPYYLNMLDPVTGTAHFEIDDARARSLLAGLRSELPGYLVPKLVREVPGASSKMPL